MPVSYQGLDEIYDATVPHLGGNVTVGDPHTWCPSVWDYVISRFGVRSMMDLGSGCGKPLYISLTEASR
jgi:hypothetical protein